MTNKVAENYDKTIHWTVRAWACGQKVFGAILSSFFEFHMKTSIQLWLNETNFSELSKCNLLTLRYYNGFVWRGKEPLENNHWENSHDKNKY